MQYLIFIFCLAISGFLISKTQLVKNCTLSKKQLVILFAIKIVAGMLVGFVSVFFYKGATDYDTYNNLGKSETYNLLHDSKLFFEDIYKPFYEIDGSLFFAKKNFLSSLSLNIITKILGIFNLVTKGNYFTNSIFFSSFSFLGCIALFNTFTKIYKANKFNLTIGCFFLPSTLYFCSGIHKDLIILTLLSLLFSIFFDGMTDKFKLKRIIICCLIFLIICTIRLYVGAILLPLAVFFLACENYKLNHKKVIFTFLFLGCLLSIVLLEIKSEISPIHFLSEKQKEFVLLGKAKTDYNYVLLNSSAKDLLIATPSAFRKAFLSPLPFEFPFFTMHLFGLEICIYFFLFLMYLFFKIKNSNNYVNYWSIFSILILIVIGYSITNAGSLVRYRSAYFPFIITPILCGIDWHKVKRTFSFQS